LGCQFYTHAEVDKVIIENGAATGVKLMNGSQVKATKFVVSAGMALIRSVSTHRPGIH